ncbi:MAG: serine/threonine-protein kinase, partial [Hyphomicrobiaceae bacterium]
MVDFRQALPIGFLLAKDYRITAVLGQGGFGLTYKADDLRLGAVAAIKEYFPGDLAVREPGRSTVVARSEREEDLLAWGRQKFLDEAKTLARFRHPNIVRVSRLFEANNTAYMVLDFEMGPNLSQWRQDLGRTPTQDEIDRISTKILDAVEAVHEQGILHRDIKPANIIMRDGEEPVLIDFGAARQALSAQSRTVHAIVTPGYSPKEQYAVDLDRQGSWSDIYALGATLYFLVTGTAPPDALSRDLAEAMPVSSGEYGRWRGGFLEAIDDAMQVDAERRPQSVTEWRSALFSGDTPSAVRGRSLGDDETILAAPRVWNSATGAAQGQAPPRPDEADPKNVRRVTFDEIPVPVDETTGGRRRAGPLIAALAAGALAMAGVGYRIYFVMPARDKAGQPETAASSRPVKAEASAPKNDPGQSSPERVASSNESADAGRAGVRGRCRDRGCRGGGIEQSGSGRGNGSVFGLGGPSGCGRWAARGAPAARASAGCHQRYGHLAAGWRGDRQPLDSS